MPAIEPTHLRQKAAVLAQQFHDPVVFTRDLHSFLEFYSDRARRTGQSGSPQPLIEAYNVRAPVIRALISELVPLANQSQEKGLQLCDALWQEHFLEFRLLATMLLGEMEIDESELVLHRVQSWITPQLEYSLIERILDFSLENVRKKNPGMITRWIENGLISKNIFHQQIGLRALMPMIKDTKNDNLPLFFRLIQPFCLHAPSGLRPDILDIISALAKRSPGETAFLLSQSLDTSDSIDAAWIIRQSLDFFPPNLQDQLRNAVRKFKSGIQ